MGATHVSALHPFDTALLSTPFVHFKIVNLGFLFRIGTDSRSVIADFYFFIVVGGNGHSVNAKELNLW